MEVVKTIVIIATTMALTILLISTTTKNVNNEEVLQSSPNVDQEFPMPGNKLLLPSKRISRFLANDGKDRNLRAADHCKKDNESCYLLEGRNSTCCNNKCMDLTEDNKNCGACKRKCAFTETCCRGQCVNLAYDKRHCGVCNHRCMPGGYCIYGMCDYA